MACLFGCGGSVGGGWLAGTAHQYPQAMDQRGHSLRRRIGASLPHRGAFLERVPNFLKKAVLLGKACHYEKPLILAGPRLFGTRQDVPALLAQVEALRLRNWGISYQRLLFGFAGSAGGGGERKARHCGTDIVLVRSQQMLSLPLQKVAYCRRGDPRLGRKPALGEPGLVQKLSDFCGDCLHVLLISER